MSLPRAPDDEELTPAQRDLVEANVGLLDEVARRHFARLAGESLPRLRSLGASGLIDAVRRYDPAKGAQLRTYAWARIRGAIRDGLRRDAACAGELVKKGALSGDEHAAWEGSEPAAARDGEEPPESRFRQRLFGYGAAWMVGWLSGGSGGDPDPETVLQRGARERAADELWATCATLPERDQRVIELRDRQGLTWPEVAAAMEVSVATAHRYHHAAMVRLGGRVRERIGLDEAGAGGESRRGG